ncbi:MAG: hypothetical protein A2X56_00605 [Nitrospirae bacterium GWC2_57_13]|jgi:aminodeoxyfutalosine deaminase|nr:MAG: hypothetical protein A2X56_00605 [Nitrospirae bacterium GWC2_57_13]HAS54973.1 hypothetical protein [Nitrospiraceae bacterium]
MILTAPILLTMRRGAPPVTDGAIVVLHDRIINAGPAEKILRQYRGHRVRSFENAVLMPGLVNVHTHLELPALLKEIRSSTLPGWVLNLIEAKKRLQPVDYRTATAENIKTLLRTGTTALGEICTHGASPALLKQSGLRAVIYHEIISMDPRLPGPVPPAGLARGRWVKTALLRPGISPHAPHTVSGPVLRQITAAARKKGLPLAMHVAESLDEVRLLQGKASGFSRLYEAAGWDPNWAPSAPSPIAYLALVGILGPRLLAVHAVHADARDRMLLKKALVPVAHCPRSNNETGVGTMPLKLFLDAGITVGLGTDSLASSPSLSLWDEMRSALALHRNTGVTSHHLLLLASTGGAKALGMGSDIGSIEAGKKADIIAIRLPVKNTNDIYSDLLRETESGIMTMVNGKILYQA